MTALLRSEREPKFSLSLTARKEHLHRQNKGWTSSSWMINSTTGIGYTCNSVQHQALEITEMRYISRITWQERVSKQKTKRKWNKTRNSSKYCHLPAQIHSPSPLLESTLILFLRFYPPLRGWVLWVGVSLYQPNLSWQFLPLPVSCLGPCRRPSHGQEAWEFCWGSLESCVLLINPHKRTQPFSHSGLRYHYMFYLPRTVAAVFNMKCKSDILVMAEC